MLLQQLFEWETEQNHIVGENNTKVEQSSNCQMSAKN